MVGRAKTVKGKQRTPKGYKGLTMRRFFSPSDSDVYETVEWEKHDVSIKDDKGETLFIQKDTERPSYMSQLAAQVVASRYFYGELGTQERENSVRQIIDRVAGTFREWIMKQGYVSSEEEAAVFEDEIKWLTLHQHMAFNSPVWFNFGIHKFRERERERKKAYIIQDGKVKTLPKGKEYEYPQGAACFIQRVEDTMEDIMRLSHDEAMLFKYGSGTGTDLSTLRSSKEKLKGGGTPSGPLSFEIFFDNVAGIVKSGGKTRRAAKMNSLRTEHPDILEFIEAKAKEQKKAECLMDFGEWSANEAYSTVAYQNTNFSVRATDDFMQTVLEDKEWQTIPVHSRESSDKMPKYRAKMLMRKIAEGTHACGDPGMQFHDTVNRWHTCPNSGAINASNPCSEFMFVDDSACNLASHNLIKYIGHEGTFSVRDFGKAVRITAIAQDSEIDNSSYPTKRIAENAYRFRPLGMGYANLGALLMYLGVPYDSDEGRTVAAAVSALMTAKVYETSAEMAEKLGPFQGFEKNKKPMLNVVRMHRDAIQRIDRTKSPKGFNLEEILDATERAFNTAITKGRKTGLRNAQATALAPTGTIGFMMDCDTTGIEPDIALVKLKLLAEGGTLKIVNQTVGPALKRLGYNESQIEEILEHIGGHKKLEEAPHLKPEHYEMTESSRDRNKDKRVEEMEKVGYSDEQIKDILLYIDGHKTIENAPHVKKEHVPVFDCAFKAPEGKRSIHYAGHLKMMAAVQPFISGAISKTINLPEDISVEEIEQAYIDAWKSGLKAVAMYRDKSKRYQPLSFDGESLEARALKGPIRKKLPTTRPSITHKFNVGGHEGYITVGLYKDNTPGETFITMSKEGSSIGGLIDSFATSISLCLQYGVPLEALIRKFGEQRFEPYGIVFEGETDRIKEAKSIVDYLFRWMDIRFNDGKVFYKKREAQPPLEMQSTSGKKSKSNGSSTEITEEKGGLCGVCGAQMIKKGFCNEICPECNWKNPRGCGE